MSNPDHQPSENSNAPEQNRVGLSGGFFSPVSERGSQLNDTMFRVDEDTFRSAMPKVTHWSIAWSDLMMTMFVLFLSLFVYQAAHKEFLVSDEIEVVGGDTAAALETDVSSPIGVPFVPIEQKSMLITVGTVKKVEPITLQDIDLNTTFFDEQKTDGKRRVVDTGSTVASLEPEKTEADSHSNEPVMPSPSAADRSTAAAPADQPATDQSTADTESVSEAAAAAGHDFQVDKELIERLDLSSFASINLVPDNTMRIILTGDLLFDSGRAVLSPASISALRKIAGVIKGTPYMINVVGHTDNVPMHSVLYDTNWELSVARASRVARFLIEEAGMSANQFVVSGYGSQRPIESNKDTVGRAANRRVEIIISKKLPAPVMAARNNPTELFPQP